MPAILGPGSVSLETCAETRKLESTESLSRGGVSFCKKNETLSRVTYNPADAVPLEWEVCNEALVSGLD